MWPWCFAEPVINASELHEGHLGFNSALEKLLHRPRLDGSVIADRRDGRLAWLGGFQILSQVISAILGILRACQEAFQILAPYPDKTARTNDAQSSGGNPLPNG